MMEDDFQYLVFIKSDSVLSQKQKKKLERYLRNRRKSGGGDCGPLTAMADNHYCVAFKDQKEQQEILRRCEHVAELSDGPLVFTVTESPPTASSTQNTLSTEPEVVCKSTEFISDSDASLSGENKPHLDEHFNHKESMKPLEKSLSSVHLHPKEQTALDKSLPPSDPQSALTEDNSCFHQNINRTRSRSKCLNNEFTRRIVVLGKTGAGKSSLANTLFGENAYETDHSAMSRTTKCQAESKTVNGRRIKLIDTPGFFDTKRNESDMKQEILKCIIESSPGPHVFLIVLKVDKYTKHEMEIIEKMRDYFSDEALNYTTVLFTHGDQLPDDTTIETFVSKSKDLSELIKKCGNRCTVIDNKYWKNSQDGYRSNTIQVNELLNTIDKLIEGNGGEHYIYEMMEKVNKDLEQEQERIKQESPNLSPDVIQEKAKAVVQEKWSHYLLRVSTDVLLKLFLGKKLMEEEPVLALGVGLTNAILVAVGGGDSGGKGGGAEEKDGTPGTPATPEGEVLSEFTRRIVVLGKTGAGKSSLANTLFGENVYEPNHSAMSGTTKCQAESKTVNGRRIKLIDTPGFFDTKRNESDMKQEILKCIIESSPGPHVFLVVLKVDKYTKQEIEIIEKIRDYFSDEALNYTTVLFTHGDQLLKGTTIEEFVSESEALSELIKKCGNRCNVIDNKYWNNSQDGYRSNTIQVNELLNTIEKIIEGNGGEHYIYEMMEKVNKDLEQEQERIKQESPNLSPDVIQKIAKAVVQEKWSHYLLRVSTDVLLKAFLGGGKKLMKEEPVLALGVGLTKAILVAVGGGDSGGKGGVAEEKDGTPGTPATPEEVVLSGEESTLLK